MIKYKIILASNSPRRKELLSGLDVKFDVNVIDDIDESYPENLKPEEVSQYVATKKASAYDVGEDEVLITADTVVIVDGKILGKPADDAQARNMLRTLSGRSHLVITGVCLTTRQHQRHFSVTTEVSFKVLSEEEIAYYVDKYHPTDKAGAYGIQEWIGYVGVTSIRGSYFNVMGLPVQRIYEELKRL